MWFTETPWPPMMICTAAVLLLLIAWNRNRKTGYLYAVGGLLVACVAIFIFEDLYETEAEVGIDKVKRNLDGLVQAVLDDDAEKAAGYISADLPELRDKVKAGLTFVRIDKDLRITDKQFRWDESKTRIISHFRANGLAAPKGHSQAANRFSTRWELTWGFNRESGWRITKIRQLEPLSDKEIERGAWLD